jgi:hypothetical protein
MSDPPALAATGIHWETIERSLQAALGLAQHFGTTYSRATHQGVNENTLVEVMRQLSSTPPVSD